MVNDNDLRNFPFISSNIPFILCIPVISSTNRQGDRKRNFVYRTRKSRLVRKQVPVRQTSK